MVRKLRVEACKAVGLHQEHLLAEVPVVAHFLQQVDEGAEILIFSIRYNKLLQKYFLKISINLWENCYINIIVSTIQGDPKVYFKMAELPLSLFKIQRSELFLLC